MTFEGFIADTILLCVLIYLIFLIRFWSHRLIFKLLPAQVKEDYEFASKSMFRFFCWLLGVKYKK